MGMEIKIDPKLESRINDIIKDVRSKQDAGKIELYNEEMNELIQKHGELGLIASGCRIVKSAWKGYIILPEKYIEADQIPSLKATMAIVLSENEER